MNESVNPAMLTLAREIRGLTQKELAQASALSQGKISRYEGGSRTVTNSDLSNLARALRFPETFFYQAGTRRGNEPTELFHRKRRKVAVKDLRQIDGLVNLHRLGSTQLLEAFEQVTAYSIPQIPSGDFEDIEEIARKVRAIWKMPAGPVHDLIGWFEQASSLVFTYDFITDKIDEVVQWIPPSPPIILVNRASPADRVRFSLAHALGHLVMHLDVVPYEDMENEADQFAASFLMPANDIIHELEPVTIQHMLELKQYWKVSMSTLIRRAYDLEVISKRRYTSLFQQLSRAGYRKNEPFPIPRETPRLVKTLLDAHKEQLGYSDEELAQLLNVSLEDYCLWYYPHYPQKIIDFPPNEIRHSGSGFDYNPPLKWPNREILDM